MWTVIGKAFVTILLLSSTVFAEDVSFEATVNFNKISLQDVLELTLSVHGAKKDVSVIPLPMIDGFDARFVGPATRFTVINGVSSSEHAFIYNLFPSKVGHYTIPSIAFNLEGQNYKTAPIDIEVVDKPAESSVSAGEEASSDQSINDKIFMQLSVVPQEVYVGEQTPIVMKVFVKDLSLQLAAVPYLTPDGFTADATANMQKSKEVLKGVNYDLLRFDTNIYPVQSGLIQVGPLQAQGDLVYRVKENNDIFGDFFARTKTRPITLNAPAVALNVLPLPMEGQPNGFSGAVGQYDFKATVGPASVKVGDPLTLRMTITGQGRLKNLVFPTLKDSRFKTYDPQIKEDENFKTVEQVIIPTAQEITEVPALSFSYFDPKEKKYKTITQGPFPIKVLAPAAGEEFKAYGFVDKTKSAPEKSLSLTGVKNFAQEVLKNMIAMVRNLWFWIGLVIAAALWFGFYMWQSFQNRLQKDESFAREWKADSKARELLKNTKAHLQEGRAKEFYSSLYKTLNDYLADKLHLPLAALTWPMIETKLKERSIDSSKLQALKELFERCDLVRFASANMSLEERNKDFNCLQDLVNYLPKIFQR